VLAPEQPAGQAQYYIAAELGTSCATDKIFAGKGLGLAQKGQPLKFVVPTNGLFIAISAGSVSYNIGYILKRLP